MQPEPICRNRNFDCRLEVHTIHWINGELLFLALASCYGNDIYWEAAKRNSKVERVEVNYEAPG
jgi:hypothetical protein